MTLDEWLRDEGLDDMAAAVRLRRNRTTISRLRRGKLMPSLALAADIERESGGQVSLADWMKLDAAADN